MVARWSSSLAFALALALGIGAGSYRPAHAQDARPVRVVCTMPHLAAIATEVGGARVEVQALANGLYDPHFLIPTPGLMAAAAAADLYVEVGMGLELWSERVIDGSRNPRIRIGQDGHVYTFMGVETLQIPTVVSRVQGDVHPLGNPHIWLDPLNAKIQARNLALALKRVDSAFAAHYDDGLKSFEARIDEAYFGKELVELLGADLLNRLQRSGRLFSFLEERELRGVPLHEKLGESWLGKMWPLRGTPFVGYHQSWAYFARAFGIRELGQIEPKPGIPPTPGHLAALEQQAKSAGVKVVLNEPYYDITRSQSFAERIGGVAVLMPNEPGVEGTEGYFGLLDEIIRRFTEAAAKGR